MDFEVDLKTIVNNIYRKRNNVSDFCVIADDLICILATNLVYSHNKFVRKQVNKVIRN